MTDMRDVLCVGHAAFDITMAVSHHPQADEKMQALAMVLGGGGPAANAAVAISRLGGRAGFCGYLGRDMPGEMLLAELVSEGVDTDHVLRGDGLTPVSQVLAKPDGARSVVNYRGQAPWLSEEEVRCSAADARVLLFDGHEPAVSLALCVQARETGTITVLDAGSVHRGTKLLADKVDVLAASRRFALDWCSCEDESQALEQLSGLAPMVVITLGERGLIWARNGSRGSLPAFAVKVKDSTGAGDAFHGALALALSGDMDWHRALRFASAAGALTCTRLGARQGLPGRAELEAFLQMQES